MATADDETTTQPPPTPAAPAGITQDQIDALVQQYMPQQPQRDTTPVSRSWTSLLGEAVGGGAPTSGMTDTEREGAGNRALMNFGTSLMAASRYQPGQTIFSNLAQGLQGAQRSELGSAQMSMEQLGAQQDWAQQQATNKLAALKEAIPLLTLQQQAQQAASARGILGGNTTTTGPNTSISGNSYEGAIAGHEGVGANPNSSAAGVGQFIAGTWNDFAAANPDLFKGMSPAQILAARSDPALGAKAISWLAQKNAGTLTAAGVTPSGQSLGIAHYLGAGPASKVMAAPDNAPVSGFVSDAAVKANPELAKMTVGQLKQRYAGVPDPGFLAPPGGGAPAKPYQVASLGATPPPPSGPPAATPTTTLPVPPIPPAGGPPPTQVGDLGAVRSGPPGNTTFGTPGGGGFKTAATPPAPPPAPPATTTPPPAPAPQPVTQATPPPAPPPSATVTPPQNPDVKVGDLTIRHPGTLADFTNQEHVPPPTTELYNPNLTPPQHAAFAAKQQGIDQQKQLLSTLPFAAQPAKAAEIASAQSALNAEQAQAVQEKSAAAAKNTEDYESAQRKALQTRYDAAVTNYNTAAQGQLTSHNKIAEIQAQTRSTSQAKVEDELNATSSTARDAIQQLTIARALSRQAGDPTFWQTVKTSHPELVTALANMGGLNDDQVTQLGASGAMDAAMAKLVTMARSGSGFQRVTNMDLQLLQSQAPKGTDPQQWREAKMGYLQSIMERQVRYASTVHSLMTKPGMDIYDAQDKADQVVPSAAPQMPAFQATPQASVDAQQRQWYQDNLSPNTFFRAPDGKHLILYAPPGQ